MDLRLPAGLYLGTGFQQHSDVVERRKHDDTGLAVLLLPDRLTRERGGGRLIFDVAQTINGLGRVPGSHFAAHETIVVPTSCSECGCGHRSLVIRSSVVARSSVHRPGCGDRCSYATPAATPVAVDRRTHPPSVSFGDHSPAPASRRIPCSTESQTRLPSLPALSLGRPGVSTALGKGTVCRPLVPSQDGHRSHPHRCGCHYVVRLRYDIDRGERSTDATCPNQNIWRDRPGPAATASNTTHSLSRSATSSRGACVSANW